VPRAWIQRFPSHEPSSKTVSNARLVYVDSSALVKLYVTEEGSTEAHALINEAAATATSRVSQVEVASAVARRVREKSLGQDHASAILRALERDLDGTIIVAEVSPLLAARAAGLTAAHALRGMDAIHLASAQWLQDKMGEPICLAAWDARLTAAGRAAGLEVAGA